MEIKNLKLTRRDALKAAGAGVVVSAVGTAGCSKIGRASCRERV